jgi:hypothetical protein
MAKAQAKAVKKVPCAGKSADGKPCKCSVVPPAKYCKRHSK